MPFIDSLIVLGQLAQRKVLLTKLLYVAPSLITGNTTVLAILAAKEEQIKVVITNQMGQPMQIQSFFLSKGSNKLTLDLCQLPSGIYQVTGYTATGQTNTIRCIK